MTQEPISRIDVQSGTLYFRGHSVAELAPNRSYEDVLYLLIKGNLPESKERGLLSQNLASLRNVDLTLGAGSSLVEVVRGIAATDESVYQSLLNLIAAIPIDVAQRYRTSHGEHPLPHRTDYGHAANLLWMLTGIEQSPHDIRDFETCLILHMDDPDNPSLGQLLCALERDHSVNGAIAEALRVHGDSLHHGAGSMAASMIHSLAKEEDLHAAISERLERGERLYGLGHRIYRTWDPRAKMLRRMLVSRTIGTDMGWLPGHVETVAGVGAEILEERKGLKVYPNVDFYNALVYATFGLTIDINTDLFAVSRIAGWAAHALEFLT